MASLDELKAEAAETDKIKKLVLKMLHLEGIIAFDASATTLDPEIEKRIKGGE